MDKPKALIYGVTGYTGKMIAAEAVALGLEPILAGRSAEKLAPLAAEWGSTYRAFGLDDAAAIDAALADVQLVLNAAGPFSRTARPLIEACIRTGSHYLDIAGEVPEFLAAFAYDEAATAAGILIVAGVGFGVVPSDAVAAKLKALLPDGDQLRLALLTEGGASRGTLGTILPDLHRDGFQRRDGELLPTRPASERLGIDFGSGERPTVLNPWRADLLSAYISTGVPTISTYSALPMPLQFMMRPFWRGLWNSRPWQAFLRGLIRALPAGPSEKELAAGATVVYGELRKASGEKKALRLYGPEAYVFTAKAAARIAQRVLLAEDLPMGYATPSMIIAPDQLLDWGLAGLRFEEVSD